MNRYNSRTEKLYLLKPSASSLICMLIKFIFFNFSSLWRRTRYQQLCVPLISARKIIALILMLISLNLSREQSTKHIRAKADAKSCFLNSN